VALGYAGTALVGVLGPTLTVNVTGFAGALGAWRAARLSPAAALARVG
jgi:hypothetical protein